MNSDISFIEQQFPVSKVSKESYKERKAVQSQTLTGLGKWWGRKPLILVRAAIIGCLMPVSSDPKKDTEIFLKILSMDKIGLDDRKNKKMAVTRLYEIASQSKHFRKYLDEWFIIEEGKPKFRDGVDKDSVEFRLFNTLSYDERLEYCCRPEQLSNIRESSWHEINEHLGTKAYSLSELVEQLSIKRYGKLITIGDCFAGGGSIPFEAARIGLNVYGSDLNPVASMLTWSDINVLGTSDDYINELVSFQQNVFSSVQKELIELGVETNEKGDNALCYLYCTEVRCPECNYTIPVSASWLIGVGSKTVAILSDNGNGYDINIKMNATSDEMKYAKNSGTITTKGIMCPHCKRTTPVSSIRHDTIDDEGKTQFGLKKWTKEQFIPDIDDTYQERLYAVKYEHIEILPNGKITTSRYYEGATANNIANEKKVFEIVRNNFSDWQKSGFIPSMPIETGYNTDQVIRERGWTYWHHLFNARQLLEYALLQKWIVKLADTKEKLIVGLLSLNRSCNWNSKLCSWGVGQARESMAQTFYNQALNTLWNYGTRAFEFLSGVYYLPLSSLGCFDRTYNITVADARDVNVDSELWITDPPYADAVNYHELSEFFLAWDKTLLKKAFPDWYTDSKRILAVRGDEHFSSTMIDIYSNLAKHMPDNGMQIVMFTHSDPAIWAQLALIMWKAGLKVTAAWNIATETDASGLKSGNYIKGTVLLVLRKQTGTDEAFLDEISSDIRAEVKRQINYMLSLDDKEDPNFSDPDLVLAAYAASLKVLTAYAKIEDLDLDYELSLAINEPSKSQVVRIIENAKKLAYDCVIPAEFDNLLWKELSTSEKFYVKGLETEKHNNYQISTYQEFARGFSVGGYSQLMAVEKANNARLKTPFEMAARTMNDVPDFENSLMRLVFKGIYVGIKEDENPSQALGYIKNELANYWDKRELIKQILSFISNTKDIANMTEHWLKSATMADLLYSLVDNDSI